MAAAEVGLPCVVKTADFGYDGKGQMKIATAEDLAQACAIFRGRRCVVEQWVDFEKEISVICARTANGETRAFPVSENIHTNHILDISIVPGRVERVVEESARGWPSGSPGRLVPWAWWRSRCSSPQGERSS